MMKNVTNAAKCVCTKIASRAEIHGKSSIALSDLSYNYQV